MATRAAAQEAIRTLHVVTNPAAGKDTPVLAALDSVFTGHVAWDVSVTQGAGDAERSAREAVDAGADAVAVYGGDGTVNEVASALAGGDVPLVLLPGGTANVMAHELGVPADLAEAASLVLGEYEVRHVDLAETTDGRRFFLRAGIGWEAESVQGADRALKDKLGELAYVLSGIKELPRTEVAAYRLVIDGATVEDEAVSCILANSASVGVAGVSLHPDAKIDDGLLDVLLLRRSDATSLLALATAAARGEADEDVLPHYQGREMRIECDPPQSVVLDGEEAGTTPLEAHVLPAAVPVLVPVLGHKAAREDSPREAAQVTTDGGRAR